MREFKAIIVDDEVINILLIKKCLSIYCSNIKVVAEVCSIENALTEIKEHNPEIVFLDIVLKEEIGFELIDKLRSQNIQIIFVTSESKFALNAFKYNPVDFIMKPFEPKDIIYAVNKAIVKIEMIEALKSKTESISKIKDFIAIPSLEKIDFLKIKDIMFFNAQGKYTRIFLSNGKKYLTNRVLKEYEPTLDNGVFFRVHRSYIINMNYVIKVNKKEGLYCELSNGLLIPISKRAQSDFNRFIKINQE